MDFCWTFFYSFFLSRSISSVMLWFSFLLSFLAPVDVHPGSGFWCLPCSVLACSLPFACLSHIEPINIAACSPSSLQCLAFFLRPRSHFSAISIFSWTLPLLPTFFFSVLPPAYCRCCSRLTDFFFFSE
jgi:hypothetical protein